SSLASTTLPSRLPASRSRRGVSWRHGPHHSAQKSTTTGVVLERSRTSASKVASVTSMTMGPRVERVATQVTVEGAGARLSLDDAGEGIPVVLLHGLTATRRYVVMGSRALERSGHRVIAYDARGHGRSSPAPAPDAYTYEDLGRDLIAVLDDRGIERAVLAGASMGGTRCCGR